MSLKSFHVAFVIVSAALAVFLILWGIHGSETALTATGGGLLLLLIPYLIWFLKKMRRLNVILLGAVFLSFHSPSLWACAVCFGGDPNSPMIRGLKMGVLAMVGIVYLVLGSIVWTAISWFRRAKKMAHQEFPGGPF